MEEPAPNPNADGTSSGAELLDTESQFRLAEHFGAGPGADQRQAMRWCLKAAERGHVEAQFHLALMYSRGKGVLCDQASALMWLRRAAEQGHGAAQYHLGVRLHRASKSRVGLAASELRIESLKWLQLAVAQSCQGAEGAREFVLLGMRRDEVEQGEGLAKKCSPTPAGSGAALLIGLQAAGAFT